MGRFIGMLWSSEALPISSNTTIMCQTRMTLLSWKTMLCSSYLSPRQYYLSQQCHLLLHRALMFSKFTRVIAWLESEKQMFWINVMHWLGQAFIFWFLVRLNFLKENMVLKAEVDILKIQHHGMGNYGHMSYLSYRIRKKIYNRQRLVSKRKCKSLFGWQGKAGRNTITIWTKLLLDVIVSKSWFSVNSELNVKVEKS